MTISTDRVRWIEETAAAVLDGRLPADEGARAAELQASQLEAALRSYRDAVPHREAQAVATRLRLLAEQVADRGKADSGDGHRDLARTIAGLAELLR
jgi:hypothetical protein